MVDVLNRVHEQWLVNREGIARDIEAGRSAREQQLLLATSGGSLRKRFISPMVKTGRLAGLPSFSRMVPRDSSVDCSRLSVSR